MQKAHTEVRSLTEKMKQRNKKYYDKRINTLNVSVGDNVLLKWERYYKFQPVHSGPFKVVKLKTTNIVIEKNNKNYEIHKNQTIMAKTT